MPTPSSASLLAEGLRTVVRTAAAAESLLQCRLCCGGATLAVRPGKPALPGQRQRPFPAAGAEPSLPTTAAAA